jgi:predicted nucleic-acid-binding protein
MNSFVIDTNCLLSYVTDRNPAQAVKIAEIFEDASNLNGEIYIISNVITEFVYTLQTVYRQDPKFISKVLSDLLVNPGIECHHSYNLYIILNLWPGKIKDYGDAVLAAAAVELGIPILTFDKDFSKQLTNSKITHKLLK